MSNDTGQTDLLDFQYFAFSLLTLGFFFVEFLTKPAGGLPDLRPPQATTEPELASGTGQ